MTEAKTPPPIKRRREVVDGVLLLDKPPGLSSNQALQRVRWMLNAKKGGHTGNLDPLAEGVLPLCFGEATKYADFGLDANKTYIARIQLGQMRDTGDAEGQVISEHPIPPFSSARIESVLAQFAGDQQQLPPMYSALKHQGRKLYELAREGKTIERQPRSIHLYALTCLEWQADSLLIQVTCSKGTYIRVLGEDIARALGSGGYLTYLRRTRSGAVDEAELISMSQLESSYDSLGTAGVRALLKPVDFLIQHLPALILNTTQASQVRQGQALRGLDLSSAIKDNARLFDESGQFLGLARRLDDTPETCLQPFKMKAQA